MLSDVVFLHSMFMLSSNNVIIASIWYFYTLEWIH